MHGTSWRSMGGPPLAGDKRQHNLLGEATSGDQNSRSCSQEKEVSAHCRGDQSQCSQLLKPILIIWWNTNTGVAGGSCRNLQLHRPPVEPWCVLVGGACNVANDCLVLTLTKLWPNYPGGTCISNMLDGLEFPNCPDKTSPRYQVRYVYVSPRIPAYSEIRIIPNPCGYYVTT